MCPPPSILGDSAGELLGFFIPWGLVSLRAEWDPSSTKWHLALKRCSLDVMGNTVYSSSLVGKGWMKTILIYLTLESDMAPWVFLMLVTTFAYFPMPEGDVSASGITMMSLHSAASISQQCRHLTEI